MATVREIVTRALRRIRVTGAGETAADEDAAVGRDVLNSLLLRWPSRSRWPR